MTNWHPATKFLLLAAVPAVAYLLWSGSDEQPPAVVANVARPQPAESASPAAAADANASAFELPPLERFTAVVERPLFSPTRRMPVLTAPAEAAQPTAEAPPSGPTGPDEPQLRFFGTESRGGTASALVIFLATSKVGRLVPGDMVGDWRVLTVGSSRLVLGQGDEERSFEIFGAGARGRSTTPQAPAADGANDATDQTAPSDEWAPDDATSPDGTAPDEATMPDEPDSADTGSNQP